MQRRNAAGTWSSILPGRPYTSQVVGTIGIRTGGRLLVPSGSVRAVQGSTASVGVLGGWARPGNAATIDPGTSWRWSIADARTVEVRFRAKAARTVVATGLMSDGATFHKVPYGFVVTSPDGTALQYTLGVLERKLGLDRSTRAGVGSAYDARVDIAQAVGRVRRGEHVVLKIRVLTPPVSPGTGG
jgi:hypothetical protein